MNELCSVNALHWDDTKKQWDLSSTFQKGETKIPVQLKADFVIMAAGLLNIPKVPDIPGLLDYKKHIFHTSRWDYSYTGGSPRNPDMYNLKDKKVGFLGTGATAIQVVPQLAKWAKELYVFQRTPSAVDIRSNQRTDTDWWTKEIQTQGPGWQRKRAENFQAFLMNASPLPEVNMVNDGWTKMPSFCAIAGGPQNLNPGFMDKIQKIDFQRQERIRHQIDEIVKDKQIADSLKPWYSGWCKRPCFHDEYLPAFNLPHVKLIDTQGKGITRLTPNGIQYGESVYDLDLIILGTGYNASGHTNPASRGALSITGRRGRSMEQKWKSGHGTLHGILSRDFPNLFLTGPGYQSGVGPNVVYVLDRMAEHVSYILKETMKKEGMGKKVLIEPTEESEAEWAKEILNRRKGFPVGCTPGYMNREGEKSDERMRSLGPWGEGIESYIKKIEEWRVNGDMKGLEISYCNLSKL